MQNIKDFFRQFRRDLGRTEKKTVDNILKLIIVEKLVKGSILWLLSLSFFPIFSHETIRFLHYIARRSHILSNARFVTRLFVRLDEAPQKRFFILSLVFLLLGTIDLVEGVGLAGRRRWAEYLAVISTSLLVPVEVYTTLTRFTIEKLAIALFNIFLVYYLVWSRKLFQFHRE